MNPANATRQYHLSFSHPHAILQSRSRTLAQLDTLSSRASLLHSHSPLEADKLHRGDSGRLRGEMAKCETNLCRTFDLQGLVGLSISTELWQRERKDPEEGKGKEEKKGRHEEGNDR